MPKYNVEIFNRLLLDLKKDHTFMVDNIIWKTVDAENEDDARAKVDKFLKESPLFTSSIELFEE